MDPKCLGLVIVYLCQSLIGAGLVAAANTNISQANDNFGLELLAKLNTTNQNVLISTFGISTALTMLMAGAAGKTYSQIYDTLGYANLSLTNEELFENYHQLLAELNDECDNVTSIKIANAVAVKKNAPLLQNFINNITDNFDSRVFVSDFSKQSSKDTAQINQWISESTNYKIAKLFTANLSPDTVMVLMNAFYFQSIWKVRFNNARDAPFRLESGKVVNMKAMTVVNQFNYAQFDDGEMIEIPYQTRTFCMYIFMPSKNISSTSALLQFSSPPAQEWQQRIQQLKKRQVKLMLPKFTIENSHSLMETLEKMGIQDAFGKEANFTNINAKTNLHVSEVVHRTLIEVNEEGAESMSGTGDVIAMIKDGFGPNKQTVVFNADRPFMFLIRDRQRELTLFVGLVQKP